MSRWNLLICAKIEKIEVYGWVICQRDISMKKEYEVTKCMSVTYTYLITADSKKHAKELVENMDHTQIIRIDKRLYRIVVEELDESLIE